MTLQVNDLTQVLSMCKLQSIWYHGCLNIRLDGVKVDVSFELEVISRQMYKTKALPVILCLCQHHSMILVLHKEPRQVHQLSLADSNIAILIWQWK
jgi:hypothetical protein